MRLANFYLSFLSIISCIAAAGQPVLDVDSFYINSAKFIVTTPEKWFSVKVQDNIQCDTTWNYLGKLTPTRDLYAQIGIQIVPNSNYTPTKQEQKKFERECSVTQQEFAGWPCYFLDYDGKKVKGCSDCDLQYTQIYSFPLNLDQQLNFVFVGQGKWSDVYPLTLTFKQFAADFISTNARSMSMFGLIGLNTPYLRDTFMVKDYIMRAIIPFDYDIKKKRGNLIFGYDLIPTTGDFAINVTAVFFASADSTRLPYRCDTSTTVTRNYVSFSGASEYIIQTKRTIALSPDKYINVTFSSRITVLAPYKLDVFF